MSLLLNSNIEEKIKRHIVGKIARVGGSVNQLLTYQNCVVEDINLVDGGYGIVRNNFRNVPSIIPGAWSYPSPAPVNPCQFFIQQNGISAN